MKGPKKISWLPVISFFAILFFIFSLGSLFTTELGGIFVAGVIWFVGTIASFFNDHYKIIHTYWTEKILPETHLIVIAVSFLFGFLLVWDFVKNFRVDISIKRKA